MIITWQYLKVLRNESKQHWSSKKVKMVRLRKRKMKKNKWGKVNLKGLVVVAVTKRLF